MTKRTPDGLTVDKHRKRSSYASFYALMGFAWDRRLEWKLRCWCLTGATQILRKKYFKEGTRKADCDEMVRLMTDILEMEVEWGVDEIRASALYYEPLH